jgi:hypothetical protein
MAVKLKLLENLPAFQRWYVERETRESLDESFKVYRSFYAQFDQLICFLDIFWPNFVEVNGLILRQERVPENLQEVISRTISEGRPLASIEYIYNHVHIHDICMNDSDKTNIQHSTFVEIAKILEEMWQQRLKSLFPNKDFVVGIGNEDAEVEVYAYVNPDSSSKA